MRCSFKFFALVTLALLTAGATADAASKKTEKAASQEPEARLDCRGTDMLAEIKASDPAAYARIEQEAAAVENSTALLWKIAKPGLEPSHLFGTMHLTDKRSATLSPKVVEALGASRALALEIADLSDGAAAGAISQASRLAVFTDGRSLKALLAPEDYAKVEKTLARSGLPSEAGRLFKPWVISLLLAGSDCERRKMQAGEPVLDMKIAEEAKQRAIPITGLETAKDQLEAMAAVPEDQQISMLRAGLAYADRTDDLVETLVQLYLGRRMGATWPFQILLAEKSGVPESAFAGFKEIMVSKRNLKMRDGSLPLLEKGGAFIAVGALHLSGPDGLVALYRQSGYTVTAVE